MFLTTCILPCNAPLSRKLFRLKRVFLEARYWMKRWETEKRPRSQSGFGTHDRAVCIYLECDHSEQTADRKKLPGWSRYRLKLLPRGVGRRRCCWRCLHHLSGWQSRGWEKQPGNSRNEDHSMFYTVICSDLIEQRMIFSQVYQRAGIWGNSRQNIRDEGTTENWRFVHPKPQ